jgi:parvulin-like peptidyl-prolyl isomerase
MGNNSAFNTWAFAAKQNDVGDIIGTQRGPIIPFLYSIRAAGIAPLEEVRAKVENDAKMEKARLLAQQALLRTLPAPTVDAAGAKLSLPALEANINRQGYIAGFTGDTSALVDAAMTAPVGEVKGPVMTGDGAVLFQVTEQKRADAAALAQNRAQYIDTLRQQESRNLRATLLQKLRKAATIDINKKLVEPVVPQQAG